MHGESPATRKAAILALAVLLSSLILADFYMPCNPYGDEAWYFYISKYLVWNWDPHLSFLPPIRWGFMLTFHPFTQDIWTFRFANVALVTTLYLLAVFLAWRGSLSAIALALAVLFDPLLLFYETHVMTSVVAGSLGALSIALALRDRFALALAISLLSVGCWEGMAFLYLALTLLAYRDKRYVLFALPAALAIATAYDNALFHARLPGWSKGPIDIKTLETLITPLGLILALYKLKRKELGDLLIYFSLPLGLVLNNFVHGTKIEFWYQVPVHIIYGVGLATLVEDSLPWRTLALFTLLFFLFINVPAFKQAVLSRGEPNCCLYEVKYFAKIAHAYLILYKPFWAYSAYPFGDVPHKVCWDMGCLLNSIKEIRRGYVLSFEKLSVPGLKLVYHRGCYLYSFAR